MTTKIDSIEIKKQIDSLGRQQVRLLDRAERLEAGDELCSHQWSSDNVYECYCSVCDKHILEARSMNDVPFKSEVGTIVPNRNT